MVTAQPYMGNARTAARRSSAWDKSGMSQVQKIPLSQLRESPDNLRRAYGDLSEMAESIKGAGIIEPIIARHREDGELEIVAGHRRARASKLAGLKEVDVIVRKMSRQDALEIMLIENTERASLNPLETAGGYQRLVDEFGLSKEQVAQRVGVSRASVYNLTSLLALAEPAQRAIAQEKLTAASGYQIARVKGERLQLRALADAMALSKDGKPPSDRAVQRLIQTRYILESKRAPTKHQREAKEHGADVALRRRVVERLMRRVVELVERQRQLEDKDLRLAAMGLSEVLGEHARAVFQRRGAKANALSKVVGAQLRSLVLELVFTAWLVLIEGDYSPAVKVVAKSYGLSLAELTSAVEATESAEALFEKG